MKINICTVKKNRGECIDFSFLLPVQDILTEEYSADFVSDVKVHGTVTNVGTGLLVKGKIQATVNDSCARCLKYLSNDLQLDFSEEYFLENESTDEEAYTYSGDFLDIKELVAEFLVTEKPVKSVCSEECKGLCPVCGNDLNEAECGCDRESIDPRLAKLRNLIN